MIKSKLKDGVGRKEGTFTVFEDWSRKKISSQDLKYYVINAASCIHLENNQKWVTAAKNDLLKSVLGEKEFYDVTDELCVLRNMQEKNKTSEIRLIQRILSLISFDLLNPLSVNKINLRAVYEDLNIEDPCILPEGRLGGSVNLFKFKLYQDDFRRIRFHIYPLKNRSNDYIEELPHEHYGDSASIILAGKLTNEHFKYEMVKEKEKAEYGLYEINHGMFEVKNAKRIGKRFNFLGYVNLIRVSRYNYQGGDHYLLPAKPASGNKELIETDLFTLHKVIPTGMTATLFGQKIQNNKELPLTTFPKDSPPNIEKKYEDTILLSPQEGVRQLSKFTEIIKRSFVEGNVRTILERTKNKKIKCLLEKRLRE